MAVAGGQGKKRAVAGIAVPMAVLALSCVYPIFFTVNNALKTNKGYILDRFGIVVRPDPRQLRRAWQRSHLDALFPELGHRHGRRGRAPARRLLARRLCAGHASAFRSAS